MKKIAKKNYIVFFKILNKNKLWLNFTRVQALNLSLFIGHRKRKWSRLFSQFLLGFRKNLILINLDYSLYMINRSLLFFYYLITKYGTISVLSNFVNFNFKGVAEFFLKNYFYSYYDGRYVGGLVSNIFHVRFTKKKFKYDFVSNFFKLKLLPSCFLIFDSNKFYSCLEEASYLGLPSIGFIDTDLNPNICLYPIVSNNESFFIHIYFLIILVFLRKRAFITRKLKFFKFFLSIYFNLLKYRFYIILLMGIKKNRKLIKLLKFFFKKFNFNFFNKDLFGYKNILYTTSIVFKVLKITFYIRFFFFEKMLRRIKKFSGYLKKFKFFFYKLYKLLLLTFYDEFDFFNTRFKIKFFNLRANINKRLRLTLKKKYRYGLKMHLKIIKFFYAKRLFFINLKYLLKLKTVSLVFFFLKRNRFLRKLYWYYKKYVFVFNNVFFFEKRFKTKLNFYRKKKYYYKLSLRILAIQKAFNNYKKFFFFYNRFYIYVLSRFILLKKYKKKLVNFFLFNSNVSLTKIIKKKIFFILFKIKNIRKKIFKNLILKFKKLKLLLNKKYLFFLFERFGYLKKLPFQLRSKSFLKKKYKNYFKFICKKKRFFFKNNPKNKLSIFIKKKKNKFYYKSKFNKDRNIKYSFNKNRKLLKNKFTNKFIQPRKFKKKFNLYNRHKMLKKKVYKNKKKIYLRFARRLTTKQLKKKNMIKNNFFFQGKKRYIRNIYFNDNSNKNNKLLRFKFNPFFFKKRKYKYINFMNYSKLEYLQNFIYFYNSVKLKKKLNSFILKDKLFIKKVKNFKKLAQKSKKLKKFNLIKKLLKKKKFLNLRKKVNQFFFLRRYIFKINLKGKKKLKKKIAFHNFKHINWKRVYKKYPFFRFNFRWKIWYLIQPRFLKKVIYVLFNSKLIQFFYSLKILLTLQKQLRRSRKVDKKKFLKIQKFKNFFLNKIKYKNYVLS